ncbi:MAG: hypothetical protein ACYDA9_12265 [Terriglobia bacterium]
MVFLIEYDRPTGTLVQFRKFDDSGRQIAQDARLDLELKLNRERSQHEVVILEAPNEEAVRHTHGRYFQTLNELIASSTARASDKDGY